MEPPKPLKQIPARYLLVLDFQATCEKDTKLKPCSEIIQFPVAIIDLTKLAVVDQFHQYVRPVYNPILTPFCTELTGITQDKVNGRLTLEQVIEMFLAWMHTKPFLNKDNSFFVTCGDWDLSTCLRSEARQKKIDLDPIFGRYINLKKYIGKVFKWPPGKRSRGMMEMLIDLGLPHQGRHHSGIDDVLNIARICIELAKTFEARFQDEEVVSLFK